MNVVARAANPALPHRFLSISSRALRAPRAVEIGRMVASASTVAAPADVGKVHIDVGSVPENLDSQQALLTGEWSPRYLQDYESLCHKLREISTLGGIGGLLQWDEAVMMPAGAAESRGKQKSVLAGVVHEKVLPSFLGVLYSCGHLESVWRKKNSRMSSSKECSHTCSTQMCCCLSSSQTFPICTAPLPVSQSITTSKTFHRRPVRS